VRIKGVVPGADLFLETDGQTFWRSPNPSDSDEACLALPFTLVEGQQVGLRQELSPECVDPGITTTIVARQTPLGAPTLRPIPCSTTPSVLISGLKREADVEFEVTTKGKVVTYLTSATVPDGRDVSEPVNVPAPPMEATSTVRVRQGECNVWSNWSDPPQTVTTYAPSHVKPSIAYKLFAGQSEVVIDGIDPVAGIVYVYCRDDSPSGRGQVALLACPNAETPNVASTRMVVAVSPCLVEDDIIWISHAVCADVRESRPERVNQQVEDIRGQIDQPVVSREDGALDVTVRDVAAGALVTLMISGPAGTVPFRVEPRTRASYSNSGRSIVAFDRVTNFWPFQLFTVVEYCAQIAESDLVPIHLHAPVIDKLEPAETQVSVPVKLDVWGAAFSPNAVVLLDGVERRTSNWAGTTHLDTVIGPGDVANDHTIRVEVRNPDGQVSSPRLFAVKRPAELTLIVKETLQLGIRSATITSVSWTVSADPPAISPPPPKTDKPNGDTSTVHIPLLPPGAGRRKEYYQISGAVSLSYEYSELTSEIKGPKTATATGGGQVEWTGSTQTWLFDIVEEHGGEPREFKLSPPKITL
jgi:hypothetical protein